MNVQNLKNPNVVVLPETFGVDSAIKQLQVSLGSLTWLQKSFGRAWTLPRTIDGKKVFEPMVYQGTKEYYPVLPNDALRSYSFWRINGPRTTVEYNANMNTGGSYIFKDNVDLFVWADLKKMDPDRDYIYKELLIREVMKRLNLDTNVQVVRVWDDRADDIFKGYTINDQHRELLMYPYTAFRIEMNLLYRFACDQNDNQGLLLLEQAGGFLAL